MQIIHTRYIHTYECVKIIDKKPKTQENVFHLMFLLWVHISNIITVLRTNKDFRISELFLYKN
jgi:hypothetical protein